MPESVVVALVAGLFGLVFGSFANVVAYRVPAGISLLRESRCPHCDAPIRWWQNVPVLAWLALRGRCAACAAPIPVRYPVVEAVTGALFALVALVVPALMPPLPVAALLVVLVAFWWFAGVSVVLTLIDLDTRTLPNRVVLPGIGVGIALLVTACLLGTDWWMLLRAGVGMVGLYALYWAIRFVRPDGMGGGDVRLAGLVGLHLGWLGWGPLAVGALGGFVLGSVAGLSLIAFGRATRRTAVAFGPWLLAGAWLGVVAGESIGAAYGGLYGLA